MIVSKLPNLSQAARVQVLRTRGRYSLEKDRSSVVVECPLTLDELENTPSRRASDHLDGCQG